MNCAPFFFRIPEPEFYKKQLNMGAKIPGENEEELNISWGAFVYRFFHSSSNPKLMYVQVDWIT